MDFSEALTAIKAGKLVTRAGWNGKGMWLALEGAQALIDNRLRLPHIIMSTVTGDLVPWVASHTDLLAEDWQEVPDGA